jgi:hypothetical protein
MRGGMPGAAGMAIILASLVGVALAASGDVVEESRFVKGAEGWTITVDGKGAADGQAQHERGMKRIKGGDTGDVAWYFTAPEKVRLKHPEEGRGRLGFLKLLSEYQCEHRWSRIYVYPPETQRDILLNRPSAVCTAILLCPVNSHAQTALLRTFHLSTTRETFPWPWTHPSAEAPRNLHYSRNSVSSAVSW